MRGLNDANDLGDGFPDNALFDAAQYAFFGKDVTKEADLGGLEDYVDNEGCLVDEDEYKFSSIGDREEFEGLDSLSEVDDLTSTFMKLNRVVGEQRSIGVIGDRGSFSRESSSAAELIQEVDFQSWIDQQILDADFQEGKRWWSQPDHLSAQLYDSKPLHRTSSYPQQQQQNTNELIFPEDFQEGKRWWSQPDPSSCQLPESKSLHRTSSFPQQQQQNTNEPIFGPTVSSFASGGQFQPSLNLTRHSSLPSVTAELNMAASSPYSGSQNQLGGLLQRPHYGHIQFTTPGLSTNCISKNWLNQASPFALENPSLLPNLLQRQLLRSNSPIHSQILSQHQQQRFQQLQSPLAYFPHLQPNVFNPHNTSLHVKNKFEAVAGTSNLKDHRLKMSHRGRQNNTRLSQHSSETGSMKSDNSCQFKSKYMSVEEIESILKIQQSATHITDPYVDDYYHQACLAKKASSSRLKQQFYPKVIKDPPSRSRTCHHSHAYVQVDTLGRVSFSSVRRPRSLLEVDMPSASGDQKSSMKPLDQEPMLAARITIEDCICLLLDIDDIDRLLHANQPQDGGFQLKRKRQVLLEVIAGTLQLVDPLSPSKGDNSIGFAPKDDLVFLRIVSLPKGRKLLCRYLHLLIPGSQLTRVVCMAVFRHLRFLFGSLPSDLSAAETTTNLAKAVRSCVCNMDLSALSACLAAVVCSSEQPPLRPFGSSAGDGASIIIKTVLDRSTDLLTDPHAATNYTVSNRALWQASFDNFFGLLTKYCLSKYDSIMKMLLIQTPRTAILGSEATRAVSREMPVELLRASLPHTNEHQRKMLLDFAQRSMTVTGFNTHEEHNRTGNSESVPG